MHTKDYKPKNTRIANINGKLLPYDFAGKTIDSYPNMKVRYLGTGFIYSIRGVVQTHTGEPETIHFWQWER